MDENTLREIKEYIDKLKEVFDNETLAEMLEHKNEIKADMRRAREQSHSTSKGNESESNLDKSNPTILQSELDNIKLSMDDDTKKNNPKKYKEFEKRSKEIINKLKELRSN